MCLLFRSAVGASDAMSAGKSLTEILILYVQLWDNTQ